MGGSGSQGGGGVRRRTSGIGEGDRLGGGGGLIRRIPPLFVSFTPPPHADLVTTSKAPGFGIGERGWGGEGGWCPYRRTGGGGWCQYRR